MKGFGRTRSINLHDKRIIVVLFATFYCRSVKKGTEENGKRFCRGKQEMST